MSFNMMSFFITGGGEAEKKAYELVKEKFGISVYTMDHADGYIHIYHPHILEGGATEKAIISALTEVGLEPQNYHPRIRSLGLS